MSKSGPPGGTLPPLAVAFFAPRRCRAWRSGFRVLPVGFYVGFSLFSSLLGVLPFLQCLRDCVEDAAAGHVPHVFPEFFGEAAHAGGGLRVECDGEQRCGGLLLELRFAAGFW